MPENDSKSASPISLVRMMKEIGGTIKLGGGLLGKSAIVLGVLIVPIAIAALRLQSDRDILIVVGIGAALFLVWLVIVVVFASKHPEATLLEGAEWSTYKQFEAYAKGFLPLPQDKMLTTLPGSPTPLLSPGISPKSDEEIDQ